MYLSLKKKASGEWVTFDERLGTGDGRTTEFPLPEGTETAGIAIMRNYAVLSAGNTFRPINETSTGPDGTIRRVFGTEIKDGYRLTTRKRGAVPEGAEAEDVPIQEGTLEHVVVFDQPPAAGTPLGFSRIGVKLDHPGISFKILPLSKKLSNRLSDTLPKRRGQSEHDWLGDTPARVKELNASRAEAFIQLVEDWTVQNPETSEVIECTEENRTLFADQKSPLYGQFVLDRSVDLGSGAADELENDRKN